MKDVAIEEAVPALVAAPFDVAELPFQFLAAFGNKDADQPAARRLQRLGRPMRRASAQQHSREPEQSPAGRRLLRTRRKNPARRERIKRFTIENRRLQHQMTAA